MSWTRRYEAAAPQRINKWLAQAGVCSRREAEQAIAEGRVFIDGARVDDPGRKIAAGQTLTLAAEAGAAMTAWTAVINKPVGYVSAQPERGQLPAVRLLTRERLVGAADAIPDRGARLAPLGRLDQDSRGLLLLSSDGVLAKAVIGPASRLDKEYAVTVEGRIEPAKLRLLRHGLSLDGRTLKPADVTQVEAGRLRFVLREGRKRQIRRMCELVELHVVDLLRTRIGPLHLGDLPEARWRPLTGAERAALIAGA